MGYCESICFLCGVCFHISIFELTIHIKRLKFGLSNQILYGLLIF